MAERLRADLVLEYPFTRTTGPVIGAFLTGLREGIILGIRRPDGTVLCPPTEYDPETSAAADRVGGGGAGRRAGELDLGGPAPIPVALGPAPRPGHDPVGRGRHAHGPRAAGGQA